MTKEPLQVLKIAIADDHKMIRSGIRRVISSYPEFEVIVEADNGQVLLEQITTSKQLPDICILDISMKVMDGYETLQHIRKLYGEQIKVLVLTMHDNEYSIIKMLRLGANGYLLKASDEDELHRALTDINNNGYYSSELVSSRVIQRIHHAPESVPKITEKEMIFLKHCCTEMPYKDIANIMNLSIKTIEGYYASLCEKFDLHSRQGLVIFAFRTGLVEL